MYYTEGSHPAIVEKELFDIVQAEYERRQNGGDATAAGGTKYTSKYTFSGLLVCGECHHKLRRHVRTVGSGKRIASWGCTNRMTKGRDACDSHHINEELLEDTFAAAIQSMVGNADGIIDTIEGSIEQELLIGTKEELASIDDEIVKLQGEVLALHKLHQRGNVKGEEYEERIADYHSRIDQLEEKRKALQTTETQFNKIKLWIDNFRDMVEAEAGTENPDTMIRSLTEQIIIYETYIEIRLKCGVSIKQEYIRKRRNFTKQK